MPLLTCALFRPGNKPGSCSRDRRHFDHPGTQESLRATRARLETSRSAEPVGDVFPVPVHT